MRPPRYISAGSIPVQANPRAIAAEAVATQNMGQTVAMVGEAGMQIAQRLRVIDEAARTEDLFSQFEKEAADFSLSLMTREDTQEWPTEWSAKSQEFQERATAAGLSPEGMARFSSRFTDWNTRRSIHLETVAANKTLELSKARFENSMQSYLDAGNYEAAATAAAHARDAGLMSSPEFDKALRNIDAFRTHEGHLSQIRENPAAWLDQNTEPPPGYDEARFSQLRSHARSALSGLTRDTSDQVLNQIVTGEITTPEQIDSAAPTLTPLAREELKSSLARYNDAAAQALRESPEGQQSLIGEASELIANYNPADPDKADADYIRIAATIGQLPKGSPIAKELTRQLDEIRTGTWQNRDTIQKAAFGALDDAFKAGRFGPATAEPTPAMTTEKAINDGFLLDKGKLSSLGFSEDQIQQLYAPVTLTNGERPPKASEIKKRFQRLWEYRSGDDSAADSFTRATAQAIVDGETDITDLSPEAQETRAATLETTRARYGKIKSDLAAWLTRNPNATEQEITEKVTTLAGSQAREGIRSALLKPRPTSKGGIKLSNYGYPSDTTPDSNSAKGIGHRNNKLIPGQSAALSKSLAKRLGVKHGDKLKIKTTKGEFEVFYHDTVPSYDKRTGHLPETIDIYRPENGSNSWGGRVLSITKSPS